MRADLAVLNNCAVPFLSRAAVNMRWYYTLHNTYIYYVSDVVKCTEHRAVLLPKVMYTSHKNNCQKI